MTSAPVPTRRPRGVRIDYGSGSVATGAFGTVPGLMLLPYLTDELGIAALWAGVIVVLPKAWDVVLNPIAGRVSDRTVDPAGPRRPWLIRAGLMLAGAFALIFAAPDLGSSVLEAGWVLVFFVLAASAYAFFQVPYVAMPAEITAPYDERTRLMTWRVAILAFTIMLAGASAPLIRDAVGGRDGYRVMGVVMAVLIVVGVVSAWWGNPQRPHRHGRGRRRVAAEATARGRARPELPGPADHLRAPGAGHGLHARRRRLPRRRGAGAPRRSDDPVRLLRRTCPPADPGVGRRRDPDRQVARLPHRLGRAGGRRNARGHGAHHAADRRLRGDSTRGSGLRRVPGDGLLAASGLVTASAEGDLELPTRMAEVNAMLDVASPAMRESLLVAFLDRLQRPVRTPS